MRSTRRRVPDAEIGTDIKGKIYVSCSNKINGRRIDADLKRLGYRRFG
jgi:hypothetical protein